MFAPPPYRISYHRGAGGGKKFGFQPTVEHSDGLCQNVWMQ